MVIAIRRKNRREPEQHSCTLRKLSGGKGRYRRREETGRPCLTSLRKEVEGALQLSIGLSEGKKKKDEEKEKVSLDKMRN